MRKVLYFLFILLPATISSCKKNQDQPILDPTTASLVQSLEQELVPLNVDPLIWSDEELQFLDHIADKSMIALGESTHGTAEFFKAKHRIFRYLVENHGYKIFAFEADFGESLLINEAVQEGRAEDIEDLMKSHMHFWTWRTREVQELLEWMCNYNQDKHAADKIHYMGVDCQFNTFHTDMVKEYLHNNGFPFTAYADSILDMALTETKNNFSSYDIGSFTPFLQKLETLKDSMLTYREALIGSSSEKAYDLTFRILEVTQQVCEVRFHGYQSSINYRDKYMAENAVWLSKYMDNKKIVLWAHNGHIADNQQQEWRAMGNYLSNELDENYTTLGFLFSMGEVTAIESLGANSYGGLKAHKLDTKPKENSLNAIMSLTGEPAFFIEIGKLQNNIKWKEAFAEGIEFFQLGAVYNNQPEDYYSEFNPDWLDYLIYFDYSTATETFR